MRTSNSAIQTFKSCPRMYELKYLIGLEPVQKAAPLERGLSYHEAVEAILTGTPVSSGDMLPKVGAMVKAFERYIAPSLDGKVEDVEKWFEYSTITGHTVIGRVDGILKDGRVLEHKTTSGKIDGSYLERLMFDEQILTYMTACKTDKIVYTVCATPTIRQRVGEDDEDFVRRCVDWYEDDVQQKIAIFHIAKTKRELADFAYEQDRMISLIWDCKLYYRNPGNCMRWGRMCEYAPVCQRYDPAKDYIGFKRRDDDDEKA